MPQLEPNRYRTMLSGADHIQLGLCSICNTIEDCVSREFWRWPMIFLEEFDDYLPPGVVQKEQDKTEQSINNVEQKNEYRGLCVNCEHRDSCKLPKAEGGIWHCEEYK